MPTKKIIARIFLILTFFNILVFIFRDYFQYESDASYESLYEPCGYACMQKWKQYIDDYTDADLTEAKKITDPLLEGEKKNTIKKIIAIGKFVYNRFHNQSGNPSSSLLRSSPLDQYKKLSGSDTVKLWCGNFAQIFSYLCWSQGIICRNIEIMNPGDHHVLNECFLPETAQWIMVDITNGILVISNSDDVLNLQQFRTSLAKKNNLMYLSPLRDTIQKSELDQNAGFIKNYYRKDVPAYYYERMENKKIYSWSNKLKRYFLPVSWYDIYDNKTHSNLGFYVKQFLMLLWIIALVVFISSRMKFKI